MSYAFRSVRRHLREECLAEAIAAAYVAFELIQRGDGTLDFRERFGQVRCPSRSGRPKDWFPAGYSGYDCYWKDIIGAIGGLALQ